MLRMIVLPFKHTNHNKSCNKHITYALARSGVMPYMVLSLLYICCAVSMYYLTINIGMPTIVDIELTNHCQARCSVCPRTNADTLEPWDWLKPKLAHISDERLDRHLNNLKYLGSGESVTVKFCGEWGDPAMYPHLDRAIESALEHQHVTDVIVNTNGGLRTPKFWTALGNRWGRACQVVFGIDGTTDAVNQRYRLGVNTERAFDNLRAYNSSAGWAVWQYLCFAHNAEDWQAAVELADTIDVYQLFLIANSGSAPSVHNDPVLMNHYNQMRRRLSPVNYRNSQSDG